MQCLAQSKLVSKMSSSLHWCLLLKKCVSIHPRSQVAKILKELSGGLELDLENSRISHVELIIDIDRLLTHSFAKLQPSPFKFTKTSSSFMEVNVQRFSLRARGIIVNMRGLHMEVLASGSTQIVCPRIVCPSCR